jgi:hypothetical protein
MTDDVPFDRAPDAAELLDYVMMGQGHGAQKRSVALDNLRGLSEFGLYAPKCAARHARRSAPPSSTIRSPSAGGAANVSQRYPLRRLSSCRPPGAAAVPATGGAA